jgi:hypothetical protein
MQVQFVRCTWVEPAAGAIHATSVIPEANHTDAGAQQIDPGPACAPRQNRDNGAAAPDPSPASTPPREERVTKTNEAPMSHTAAPYLRIWLDHVKALASDIGPRGSTTDKEKEGSDYCRKVFQTQGLAPQVESFMSATSIFQPHLLAAAFMLVAFVLYPLFGRASAVLAAALSLVSLASQLLELGFRDNLFRRLVSKAESQNVIAVMPPADEPKQDLILIGHVDSQRTPLVFRSAAWVKAYQTFTTVAFILSLAQTILYTIGAFTQWTWIWPVTVISALSSVVLAAMCIEADSTPFSPGANDNATAAGLVLTLAQHLRSEPLQNTRVWLVCTGCEEVQHYGAIDFFRRHTDEFTHPVAVVFEMLGCAGPAWLIKEGIIVPFHSDRRLVQLAEQVAEAHPELGAYPSQIKGGNTEMSDALRVGIPAITLNGMGPKGEMPYWHQAGDTVDKMDPEVMARAYQFTWAYITELDARAGALD